MAYFMLEDFAAGVDVRKTTITAKPGSLRTLNNGFVNAGGEIEKRRKFALLATAPANTAGIAAVSNSLYTFGTDTGVSVPAPLIYQKLTPSSGSPTISRVLDADSFQTGLFVIARMSDASTRRFYSGTQVVAASGLASRAHKSKMYVVEGDLVRFSAVNAPSDFAGAGSGFIDVTTQDQGSADLLGIEEYYNNIILLGRRAVQVWFMDPDPNLNQIIQVLGNIGLVASQGVARYGSGDVLFLSTTGIRSVRARDGSNSAVVNDIGSPIDPIITERRLSMSSADADRIKGLIEPMTGHFWLVWNDNIYVLSYYPATKVTAWSIFTLPFTVDYAVAAGNRVVLRSGNDVYVYGGFTSAATALDNYIPGNTLAAEYDTTQCQFETPMLDLGKPAHYKSFVGFDAAIEGSWMVEVNFDPLAPDAWVNIGTFSQSTYSLARIPVQGYGTHIAIRMTSQGTGPARVGAIAIHHEMAEDD
jgi:hypothetical protein